jgi:hypothetical protein
MEYATITETDSYKSVELFGILRQKHPPHCTLILYTDGEELTIFKYHVIRVHELRIQSHLHITTSLRSGYSFSVTEHH